MDNPRFVDDENIPLLLAEDRDNDYDDNNTPNTSITQETTFTDSDTTERKSTLRLRQKVKGDKLIALYRHLNVTSDPYFADIDQFKLTTDPKKGAIVLQW